MDNQELFHHKRVIEMLTTSYGILRDRYNYYANMMDLIILSSSALMCTTLFIDHTVLEYFGIMPSLQRIIIGIFSLIVFILSIWQHVVRWKQKASLYAKAYNDILIIRSNQRSVEKFDSNDNIEEIKTVCHQITTDLANLPPIPDAQFLKLKAAHKRKVEMSKYIDTHAGMSYWLIWVCFNYRVFCRGERKKNDK